MSEMPQQEASALPPASVFDKLQGAGARMDRFGDDTLRAVEAVHKALLGSGKASYGDRDVDPENWTRLPVIIDVDIPTQISKDEEYWAVVPWASAVMPSAADYLRAVLGTFGHVKPKRFIIVTPDDLSAEELRKLAESFAVTVLAVHAGTLTAAGPEQALERLRRVTGEACFGAHAAVDIRAVIARHNAELTKADEFYDLLEVATPRAWATPAILGANVLVFAAMVAAGVSFWSPDTADVFAWGGSNGPLVVNGEWWRLLSANYLHFGFLHLAFNMWCLWQVGRFAERLLGNWAFVLAYTFSGIGGAIASIAHKPGPEHIGAGASGAVFGIFGCILGFMLVRRRTVPVRVFKPLVMSILSFLGYNIYFSLTMSHIDNFAHGGGLFVGFLCGMLFSRAIPVPEGGTPRRRYSYALIVVVLLIAGAVFAAARVRADAQGRRAPSSTYAPDGRALRPAGVLSSAGLG